MGLFLFIRFVFLLTIVIWVGSVIFHTLIILPTLYKNLTYDQAGMYHHHILAKYFPLNYVCALIAIICLILSASLTGSIPWFKLLIIIIMISCVLYNTIILYPRSNSFKEEMMSSPSDDSLLNLKGEYERTLKIAKLYHQGVLILGVILILLIARGLSL
ncbi:MAG: hypothetical protein A3I75_01720 [Deltaproteobacteria bacterium RIFCSPLOWO2_02_FULL_50_16]|nr:MAG: hypothetical protein A2053_06095 [Deltaproteobacteria bacterium GWA2_50_8]OGQ56255.1 MAG: hypothetical protein A3I75_01720 [Deltaproteobacteria bacterium RIFCSPLOWO2_02_FULL_50_16]OGQ68156.1 MAG: hypothetical protein A3F89_00295 [Deltaproteobacteria bacterium RIFCSPLOWO2_12_FULL_50_11]